MKVFSNVQYETELTHTSIGIQSTDWHPRFNAIIGGKQSVGL